MVDSFLNYLLYERNYSQCTVEAYSKDLEQFLSFVGEKQDGTFDLAMIDADIVRNWIIHLMDKRYSPVSVNRKLSSLKSFFKFLMKQRKISVNPLLLINGPKMKKPLPCFVKEKEMDLLLVKDGFCEDFEGVRNRLILEMFYDTGMRCSELVGVQNLSLLGNIFNPSSDSILILDMVMSDVVLLVMLKRMMAQAELK